MLLNFFLPYTLLYNVCWCHVHAVTGHVQKREFDPLQLELQVVVIRPIWVLGTECLSYERATSTVNHWDSSLAPPTSFLEIGSLNEPGPYWLARESQGSSCFYLRSFRTNPVHTPYQGMVWILGIQAGPSCFPGQPWIDWALSSVVRFETTLCCFYMSIACTTHMSTNWKNWPILGSPS